MQQPLIGITTHRSYTALGVPLFAAAQAYAEAIIQAGGAPVLIPLGLSESTLETLLNRLDGLLFSGGGDIAPETYGSQPDLKVDDVDRDRDQIEFWLVHQAIQRPLPFLGICRGLQVINVALGGTLYSDILDQHPGAMPHQFFPGHPRSYRAHTVKIASGSHLAQFLDQDQIAVNSLHHQGVNQLADKALANALAPDGILEGLEIPDHPFGMAVQWHPEWMQDDLAMQRLFQAFVQASSENHQPSRSA